MRLRIDIDVDDALRRAIRNQVGKLGLASRDEVREWAKQCFSTDSDAICEDDDLSEQSEEQP